MEKVVKPRPRPRRAMVPSRPLTEAATWGVQPSYEDAAGNAVPAPPETVAAVLAELGAGAGAGPSPAAALILRHGDRAAQPLEVLTEDGRHLLIDGVVTRDVPFGYHTVLKGGVERSLVVSPGRCHLPLRVRLGGWAVQVYGARSRASWGIGDLADVRAFGAWAAAGGAGFALLSPLNAAALAAPIEASPYLPTSRRWRNPLFLRVEDVPGCTVLGDDLDLLARSGRALNKDRLINRDAVARLKLDALARILAGTTPASAFAQWRTRQGEDLERFATYSVIAERHGGDFRAWPEPLRDADGAAVAEMAAREAERVRFHAWLQWLLDTQLAAAAAALPLMTDLPIGVGPGGADVWADRSLFAAGFSVGAPPDMFNTLGQDWAQPPWNPWRLRERGYAPFIAVLRSGFAHAMGLRIDHVMGLFRLFWIPRGSDPSRGVFVRLPSADLLAILALESARAGALVVGEDLGTVEPVVRREMTARRILSYRLLWFEEGTPSSFPRLAMSAVTTHDLPTVSGVWTGADVEAMRSIGLPVNEAATTAMRERLGRVTGAADATTPEAIEGAYGALAACPSLLVAAALEDAAAVAERPNMPGTSGGRWPNWCLALPRPLEEVLASPLAARLGAALSRRGGGRRGPAGSEGRRRGSPRSARGRPRPPAPP